MKNIDKCDVVIGNPPYQAPNEHTGRGKCGISLWENFVKLSIDIIKDKGYVCLIHPSRWRKPKNKIGEFIKSKQILHLEIHGLNDGMNMFGVQSRYDWYVLKNIDAYEKTVIVDQEGNKVNWFLGKISFIPNSRINKIMSLVAKNDEEKCEVIYSSSAYETRKKWMHKTKTKKFKYPCVYSINSKGKVTFWYSSKREQFFDIPKVIFPSGAYQSVGILVDNSGEYGLTQFARGIVDTKSNLSKIAKALRSEEFVKLYPSFSMSSTELDKDIISLFRKDFWKEFV